MTPFEYVSTRGVGAIDLDHPVAFAAGYDPDYFANIKANGQIDFEYFQGAGIFSKPNPSQGKLAGDKGKVLSDEDGGSGGHNGGPQAS